MSRFYAHSLEGRPEEEWELLGDHLHAVATKAAQFGEAFGAGDWARLAGSWHDLGKYSKKFQDYLRSANGLDAHLETSTGKVDHSTAGALYASAHIGGVMGRLLAYCIAGHHGGLPDNRDPEGGLSGLADRLKKEDLEVPNAPTAVTDQPVPANPLLDWHRDPNRVAFQASVLCRMLFSCLVDADYLATETFMQPDRSGERIVSVPALDELLIHVRAYLEQLQARAPDTPVNRARAHVLQQCRDKSLLPPGCFSLTVPTGGGKTLSSLAFALHHATQHDLRRVIYAIPFTSIVEQNTDVFRAALAATGQFTVLEHHSNLDPDQETRWGRLAAENWDAPLVVTTNVQLFESLFANKPSRCRKLHRIARSVIILDECQTLPVTLLAPTLSMLDELCRNYGCTVVLCSATQPAIAQRDGFPIGLANVREIIDDPPSLFSILKRVDVERVGKLADEELAKRLTQHEQVLCIVNTRAHAAKLFTLLKNHRSNGVFHLSASMCAAHRTDVLNRIRECLDPENPDECRVISTQLIEAGVDIDFPVVFRAMTGIDSIAQAAGRCNREGRLACGQVFVFETDVDPRGDLRLRRQMGQEVAGLPVDLLGLDAVEQYFSLLYWLRQNDWDQERIFARFALANDGPHLQFREAARAYKLIADTQQPVIVPYTRRGESLISDLLRMPIPPGRSFDRLLQRYVVGTYNWQHKQLLENNAVSQYHERFWVLHNDSAYGAELGLQTDVAGFDPARLCI